MNNIFHYAVHSPLIKMLMIPCSVLCATSTRRLFALAILNLAATKMRPHKPMLAEWTNAERREEILVQYSI